MSEIEDKELGKLRWRCRRGVRELDVLMTHFIDQSYANLSDQEKNAFNKLLEVQDPIIMDWVFGRGASPDKDVQLIVLKLVNLVNYLG